MVICFGGPALRCKQVNRLESSAIDALIVHLNKCITPIISIMIPDSYHGKLAQQTSSPNSPTAVPQQKRQIESQGSQPLVHQRSGRLQVDHLGRVQIALLLQAAEIERLSAQGQSQIDLNQQMSTHVQITELKRSIEQLQRQKAGLQKYITQMNAAIDLRMQNSKGSQQEQSNEQLQKLKIKYEKALLEIEKMYEDNQKLQQEINKLQRNGPCCGLSVRSNYPVTNRSPHEEQQQTMGRLPEQQQSNQAPCSSPPVPLTPSDTKSLEAELQHREKKLQFAEHSNNEYQTIITHYQKELNRCYQQLHHQQLCLQSLENAQHQLEDECTRQNKMRIELENKAAMLSQELERLSMQLAERTATVQALQSDNQDTIHLREVLEHKEEAVASLNSRLEALQSLHTQRSEEYEKAMHEATRNRHKLEMQNHTQEAAASNLVRVYKSQIEELQDKLKQVVGRMTSSAEQFNERQRQSSVTIADWATRAARQQAIIEQLRDSISKLESDKQTRERDFQVRLEQEQSNYMQEIKGYQQEAKEHINALAQKERIIQDKHQALEEKQLQIQQNHENQSVLRSQLHKLLMERRQELQMPKRSHLEGQVSHLPANFDALHSNLTEVSKHFTEISLPKQVLTNQQLTGVSRQIFQLSQDLNSLSSKAKDHFQALRRNGEDFRGFELHRESREAEILGRIQHNRDQIEQLLSIATCNSRETEKLQETLTGIANKSKEHQASQLNVQQLSSQIEKLTRIHSSQLQEWLREFFDEKTQRIAEQEQHQLKVSNEGAQIQDYEPRVSQKCREIDQVSERVRQDRLKLKQQKHKIGDIHTQLERAIVGAIKDQSHIQQLSRANQQLNQANHRLHQQNKMLLSEKMEMMQMTKTNINEFTNRIVAEGNRVSDHGEQIDYEAFMGGNIHQNKGGSQLTRQSQLLSKELQIIKYNLKRLFRIFQQLKLDNYHLSRFNYHSSATDHVSKQFFQCKLEGLIQEVDRLSRENVDLKQDLLRCQLELMGELSMGNRGRENLGLIVLLSVEIEAMRTRLPP